MVSTMGSAHSDSRIVMLNGVLYSHCKKLARDIHHPCETWGRPVDCPMIYFAAHGVGFQPVASACFLNCELVMKDESMNCGSVTTVVTISQVIPASVKLSKYSSTVAFVP